MTRSRVDDRARSARGLVPHQATFALLTTARRRSLAACLFRQMMWRRIMLPCCLWLGWSVPSSAK